MADNPNKMSRAADVARSISPFHFAARRLSGGSSPAAGDQATRETADHIQQIIDIAGIIDQTGIADVSNMLISLMRAVDEPEQRWTHMKNAALSSISALPLFGDFAKYGKQYRAASHGIHAAETVERAATSKGTRDLLKASAGYAKQHPGVILAFVHRAAHLLGILSSHRKKDKTNLQAAVDVIDELQGAYADFASDIGFKEAGTRIGSEQLERLRGKAYGEAGEPEEDEEFEEEVEAASSAMPVPDTSPGPAVASGTSQPPMPGGQAQGYTRAALARNKGTVAAGAAAAAVLTGGSFMWWRRKQRRKAQREAYQGGYTVRLPDGTTQHYPTPAAGSAAVFATRPGGDGTRVFWGSAPQSTQASATGRGGGQYEDGAAGEGTGPVNIAPPQGPGWGRRLATGLWHMSGPGILTDAVLGMGHAWGAANKAVTSIWRVPGRVGRKVLRTGAQLGVIGGPLGMYMTGGPAALIRENMGLVTGTRDLIHKFRDLVDSVENASSALMTMQDHLIQYSGAMASAKAQYIADQIRRDMEMAQATGGTYGTMLRARGNLQDDMVKYRAFGTNISNLLNAGVTTIANWGLNIVEALTPLDELVDAFNNWWGGAAGEPPVVNMIRNIADGTYSQPRRPRRPPGG